MKKLVGVDFNFKVRIREHGINWSYILFKSASLTPLEMMPTIMTQMVRKLIKIGATKSPKKFP